MDLYGISYFLDDRCGIDDSVCMEGPVDAGREKQLTDLGEHAGNDALLSLLLCIKNRERICFFHKFKIFL